VNALVSLLGAPASSRHVVAGEDIGGGQNQVGIRRGAAMDNAIEGVRRDWKVLLIGGPSGVGKTTVAREIRRRVGVDWLLAVDDIRLAFQHSRVSLPDARGTEALYLFWDVPDVWQRSPEDLCDGLIAVGQAMSPAIEVVTMNHVDQGGPIVIEGDNIVPSLFARPFMRERATGGRVRCVFLVEPEEGAIRANIVARGRIVAGQTEEGQRTETRAKWLYGRGWPTRRAATACRSSMLARGQPSRNASWRRSDGDTGVSMISTDTGRIPYGQI